MRLSEKHSGNMFNNFFLLHPVFSGKSPEIVLKRSLTVMDHDAVECMKSYIVRMQTAEGGFSDKAGKADLYYTLFGVFMAEALEINSVLPPVRRYLECEISNKTPDGVHLHCAAILASRLGIQRNQMKNLQSAVRNDLFHINGMQLSYHFFLHLLTCYYIKDYRSIWLIKRMLSKEQSFFSMPCTVIAAYLVLQRSFQRPVDELKEMLLSFYLDGGFRATHSAPVPDLLSTSVAMYALDFAGHDLRLIKPDCLGFIDSLFTGEGFAGSIIDNDADIEYTFYGLLSLGALAE